METVKITANELLEELRRRRAPEPPPDAMTAQEIGAALGIGRSAVKARLAALRRDGLLVVWQKRVIDASGRANTAPAYTIKPAKRKGK